MLASRLMALVLLLACALPAQAHHVLGRPAYSLGEDSNTPPSMQIETQIGDYYVTMMAFPAFPQPGEQGRINLYASRIEDGKTFNGEVTFTVRDDSWFAAEQETLGTQPVDDGVYRQGFVISSEGDYIVSAQFGADGAPYVIDFPLRIGAPAPVGPLGITLGVLAALLIGVNVLQRRRLARLKASRHHAEVRTES